MVNRYCGPFLTTQSGGTTDFTICGKNDMYFAFPKEYLKMVIFLDCSAPFVIDVYTDALDDMSLATAPGANTALSRGIANNYIILILTTIRHLI
jgi:hypothetical protein